jgi:hypothetical protein
MENSLLIIGIVCNHRDVERKVARPSIFASQLPEEDRMLRSGFAAIALILFVSVPLTSASADYKKGQGPRGAHGNQCHCNDQSGGMDCLCGSPLVKDKTTPAKARIPQGGPFTPVQPKR